MLLREPIKYLSKRVIRKDSLENGLPFRPSDELEKSKIDWVSKYGKKFSNRCMLYEENYSNISWGQISVTRNSEIFNSIEDSNRKIINIEKEVNIKIPHSFLRLKIRFKESESMLSKWTDSDDDEKLIAKSTGFYLKVGNVNSYLKQLYVREYISRLINYIWIEYKICPTEVRVIDKMVHFVDTSDGTIEKVVVGILSKILGISSFDISQKLLSKYRDILYYLTDDRICYIYFYEELKSIMRSCDKLIYASEYRDNASRYVGRINYDEMMKKEILNLIDDSKMDSVLLSPPHFDFAIAFRDQYENIIGLFHLSSLSGIIENERKTIIDTSKNNFNLLLNFLKENAQKNVPPSTGQNFY